MKKRRTVMSILAFLIILLTNFFVPRPVPPPVESQPDTPNDSFPYFPVVKIVDGDTIMVDIEGVRESVRLIGIDTPEVVDPRKPVQCFGREASQKAKELLTGKSVRLEDDPSQGDRDRYGRLLRYVFLPDGMFFNDFMIRQGYAHEYTYNLPYIYKAQFEEAQNEAMPAKRGLWADGVCEDTE